MIGLAQESMLLATSAIGSHHDTIGSTARSAMVTAHSMIREQANLVLGFGPEQTLKRGYAVARTPDGDVVSSAALARQQVEMTLTFRDGNITVTPCPAIPLEDLSHDNER